jgi:hypothetical protein
MNTESIRTSLVRSRGGVVVVAVAVAASAALLAGCSSGSHHSASAAPASAAQTSSVASVSGSSAATTPSSSGSAVVRTPAIDTISLAVAKRSRDQVTQLHALAVNAGHPGGIPAAQIPLSAKQIVTQLTAQAQACTVLHPAATTPAGQLAAALTGYQALAKQLSTRTTTSGPLAASYFTQLKALDTKWSAAMKAIGTVSHTDLLAGMAPLLLPKA